MTFRKKLSILAFLFFVLINTPRYIQNNTYYSGEEYLRTTSIPTLLDEKGEGLYTISFKGKTKSLGSVLIYLNHGYNGKYMFADNPIIEMTSEYKKYSVEVEIKLNDNSTIRPYLSFYGFEEEGGPHYKKY